MGETVTDEFCFKCQTCKECAGDVFACELPDLEHEWKHCPEAQCIKCSGPNLRLKFMQALMRIASVNPASVDVTYMQNIARKALGMETK